MGKDAPRGLSKCLGYKREIAAVRDWSEASQAGCLVSQSAFSGGETGAGGGGAW